jgi:purine-binding chemotaxis protein CheW
MEAKLNETISGSKELAGKYLTFSIRGESYGIDVLKIREIIRLIAITAVPQMPAYVRGVVNLRGKIIPVLDLRLRFGFDEAKSTEQTCIVVVLVKLPGGKSTQMGLVVDAVEEVVNISAADIEETPDFGAEVSTDCLLGMAKIKGAVKTLLDIDRVLAGDVQKLSQNLLNRQAC